MKKNLPTSFSIRKVKPADESVILKIRNEIDVRMSSDQTDRISRGEHRRWFNRNIKTKPLNFFVALSDKKMVGYVRFDKQNTSYDVSIAVTRSSRDKGVGSRLLNQAMERFSAVEKLPIIAKIKKKNLASIKLFAKNKYKYYYQTDSHVFMVHRPRLVRVLFYGGQTAGAICLLGLYLRPDVVIKAVIPQDEKIKRIALTLGLPLQPAESLDDFDHIKDLNHRIELLICCHGRKILKKELTDAITCINFHPCLYKYKGSSPIRKVLENRDRKISVGAHFMTEQVDEGPVIDEIFVKLDRSKSYSEFEIYNELYPVYLEVLFSALEKFGQ